MGERELKENWLTEGLIDFEYKKYTLLAYLTKVREAFGKVELYPSLSDLVFHYRNLVTLKENKDVINESFPTELSPESIQKLELSWKKIIDDDAIMKEIESIIAFALPEFKNSLDEGAQIYEHVESNCEISPVGLTSLYAHEGYLFLSQPPQNETNVFRYQLTFFEQSSEAMRGIHMQHLRTTERSLSNTYEHIKLQLIREFTSLPNPAVYLVHSKLRFPYIQTLVPVAKRLLIKQISSTAA
ncbi:MAG TPA: hypothetical protein VK508_06130 [Cyclobacteriaceae bacterium]|nr:hypothetical protein [Cyclobacteriaceae bacterium]